MLAAVGMPMPTVFVEREVASPERFQGYLPLMLLMFFSSPLVPIESLRLYSSPSTPS